MADPFLGEIRLMSFNFAPRGWALCNGQFLPISQNQALFSLLGTMYGGNGQTTFALPDLRGRVPIHVGGAHSQGERAGEITHTVTINEMPQHIHAVDASSAATGGSPVPTGRYLGGATGMYHAPQSPTTMHTATITSTGGSQPHPNMAPYLVISFCIALQGIYPSRN